MRAMVTLLEEAHGAPPLQIKSFVLMMIDFILVSVPARSFMAGKAK